MKNIFDKAVSGELIARINNLTADTAPNWGTMNVGQMLAHCCVSYEFVFEDIHKKPNAVKRFLLTLLIKPSVVSDKPYSNNSRTAPVFIKDGTHDFDVEKGRLTGYINKSQELGTAHFDGLDYQSFGKMTTTEFSNCFYKHLDHHLKQFGV
ncbi:MAG: hypothetical protein ACI9FU_001096 [Granulosicoccus sp.]|jgi:hypothetical protein